ncbi:hypothetical protein SJ05684_c13730 [Sinorhizobium sojae CCBAU 05684]|uniref:Uncharacterized protein n=1 Tax=Sinorhizobium sojae CCBAU 05684 TaxID=716928 RepID=A0A249PA88_9HYPH|nr:hypothetical protein SJ05684_c13730 [Sinorhizobium sojae CCBAU 05684]
MKATVGGFLLPQGLQWRPRLRLSLFLSRTRHHNALSAPAGATSAMQQFNVLQRDLRA